MGVWIAILAAAAAGYLLGSTPTAYVAGRLFKGIDIRDHGSGSVGATNALRTLGAGPALLVLIIDLAKGTSAVVFARWSLPWFLSAPDSHALAPWVDCVAGLAVVVGHSRSVWLGFTGGKSAATGLGVLLAMSWPVGLAAAGIFALSIAVFRIVSLASMLAATSAVLLVVALDQPTAYQLLVGVGALYVVARHRANIGRLLAGTEPRLGQRPTDGQRG
jgi:glycerol-3-phosphate acyltransferase PlsY